nr:sodium:solute symporter [Caldithrix abyssi]
MKYLNTIDYTVITIYFLILVGLGIFLQKRASKNIEEYFLGGHKLPWWAMGFSGMASFLDVAGTMLIVSFLFMLGPRGLYIEFRGGAVLILAFMLVYTGKWHYRSKVMTGAEWMEYRFGTGWGGQFARMVSAIATIVGTIGMLAYMVKGVGLFLSMFLPFSPLVCSLIMLGVATLYTMTSGFYGVVYTDVFQSFIIISAVIFISIMAGMKITDADSLAALAYKVTGNSQWMSSALQWETTMPKGYEAYRHLMLFAFFYLLRNVLGGMASGADPKYFGARNERETGLLSFMWTVLMMFRWPMMIGFAVLGLYLVNDIFPDQTLLSQAATLIKTYLPHVPKERWADTIAGIMNRPMNYPPELIDGLKHLFQDHWQEKLNLLSFEGTVNPERILPAVILFDIPIGVRGLLLVALIAASMSTFDSTVNATTAFFTRDIYQRHLRPRAKEKELIYMSYAFTIFLVICGFLLAYTIRSINDVWGWIIMGLGGGLAIPAFLKFYWWRFNGEGFAIGTLVGMVAAILQRMFFPDLVEWLQFTILSLISLAGIIIGTFLTSPTDEKVLVHFYKTTRPFGFWKPYKNKLDPEVRKKMEREHKNDIIALPLALCWQVTLFLLPMQFLIKTYDSFMITFAIFAICLVGLYRFWYKNLPPKEVTN